MASGGMDDYDDKIAESLGALGTGRPRSGKKGSHPQIDMNDVQRAFYSTEKCEKYIHELVSVMNQRLELLSEAIKKDDAEGIEHQKSMLETVRKRLIYAEYFDLVNV